MTSFREKVTVFLNSEDDNAKHLFNENLFTHNIPAELGAEWVDQHGGEGKGDEYWWIFSFKDPKTDEKLLVKLNGSYASYVGAEFDEWFFVVEKEVMVTRYEKELL